MKKDTLFYYFKKYQFILFLISLGLSLYGSYLVYHGKYPHPLKEVMVILYSTFKLFTFSPTQSITSQSPLVYELAIWLAPTSTVIGFFAMFQKIYLSLKNNLYHLKKSEMIIMGDRASSFAFIKNVYKENPKIRISYLVDRAEEVDEEPFHDLKVEIVKLDFNQPGQKVNAVTFRDKGLYRATKLISFENEPSNYGCLLALHSMLKNQKISQKIQVYLQVEDLRMREMVEPKLDQLECFDIHYFKIEDLLVKSLLEHSGFNMVPPQTIRESWAGKTFKSAEEIGQAVGAYRLLIVGFSSVSESFIGQVTNLLTLNPFQPLQVTIVDEKVANKAADFIDYRREIAKVVELKLLELPNGSSLLQAEVAKEHSREPYSAVLFAHEDSKKNIFNLDRLADILVDVPFAVYAKETLEIVPVIESLSIRHSSITVFGDKDRLLTKEIILEESLLTNAKRFNAKYNATMSELMTYPADERSQSAQWESLSSVKKDSSAYQTAHRPTKKMILEKFLEVLPEYADSTAMLEQWQSELADKTVSQRVDYIESHPFLNYMTALEHQRWNNFYYMRNFVFGQEKDEIKKTHDCLIDDWSEFLASKQRDKAIFDTISTLDLREG